MALDVGMHPNVGMNVVLISAVAVILGGIGVFEGPVFEVFVLGLLQNIVIKYLRCRTSKFSM